MTVRRGGGTPGWHAARLLAHRVERGGGLVEQQDVRVAVERARDREALQLAAREVGAVATEQRVEAVRHLLHESVTPRPDQNVEHEAQFGLHLAHGDVLQHRAENSSVVCGTTPTSDAGSRCSDSGWS